MQFTRSSGILLHPTSLPNNFGIGDFGSSAYKFVDFLSSSGFTFWQFLPLTPTGFGDSPYQSFSAFAGNRNLISPELLLKNDFLDKKDLKDLPKLSNSKVEFSKVNNQKESLLRKSFQKKIKSKEYKFFISENEFWLNDYALFMSLKKFHNGRAWFEWENDFKDYNKAKKQKLNSNIKKEIEFQKFVQFLFFSQWRELQNYAKQKKIKFIGDLPIFVAHDSADVWANQKYFTLTKNGALKKKAGVPPDYFSKTGQLWGNPLYDWKNLEKNNFAWWKKRISHLLKMVDIIRIDHFRGFEACWEIPGYAKTAKFGKWKKNPGIKFFNTLKNSFTDLPIIAEDLGFITSEVRKLRDRFNFPGMRIMQFAFGVKGEKKFLSKNFIENTIAYTGTHDNDTTCGFFEKEKRKKSSTYKHAKKYLQTDDKNLCKALIIDALKSRASIAIFPMQDILNLDSKHRMNFPGKIIGNWQWRMSEKLLTGKLAKEYLKLNKKYLRT